MQDLQSAIQKIKTEFSSELNTAKSTKTIEELRVKFLGKKSPINDLMAQLKNLPPDEKRELGPKLNELKQFIEQELHQSKSLFIEQEANAEKLKNQFFDVSINKTAPTEGRLHPYTQFIEEIENIFISMGYEILDGPEVETDQYNFTGLNIPKDHPARDMYDTFWLDKTNYLLRTHTSPMQVRTMETQKPPIAAVVPGRTYRHEAVDATHDFVFMQCEGFFIDKNVSMSHLFGTAQTFLKALFKKDELDIRIRPGFFPFVEPGVEIDMRCPFCKNGCSVCKKSTWVEVFPGGLIHPNVLRAGGLNPEEYSGFAFGFGLTRLAMLRYNIDDVRLLYSGNLKFLEQF